MNAALEWLVSGRVQKSAEVEHLRAELATEERKKLVCLCLDKPEYCDDDYVLFLKRQLSKREKALKDFEEAIDLIRKEVGNDASS